MKRVWEIYDYLFDGPWSHFVPALVVGFLPYIFSFFTNDLAFNLATGFWIGFYVLSLVYYLGLKKGQAEKKQKRNHLKVIH